MNHKENKRISYPRVSEIIGKQTAEQMRKIPIETLANAQLRGIKIDEYCKAYVKGFFLPSIEVEYIPYVDAFKEWFDTHVDKLISTGERLYDDDLEYTGEYDLIVQLKESELNALIDIKATWGISKSWPIQLAAYENLLDVSNSSCEIFCNLHLKKSKDTVIANTIRYTNEEMKNAWKLFSNCLECYNYFDRKESKDAI